MNAGTRLICGALSLLAASCAVLPQASDFEAGIARMQQTDPDSPAVLSAQLAYADFLLTAGRGSCEERLGRAQQQLDGVAANPKTRVLFPDGWSRESDLEYRLHFARAACSSGAARESELRSAVVAARRAVELYRNAFDYRSMVTMQANVAELMHQLAGNAAATSALETALAMDRELGFESDARENYQLLLGWQGKAADAAAVAALMRDFPSRHAVLTFGWHSSDARTALESHRECLCEGQIVSSRAGAEFESRIRPSGEQGGGWSVSYSHRTTHYEPGVWPTMQDQQTPPGMAFLPGAPPPADFKVSVTGEFEGVADDIDGYADRLRERSAQLTRAAAGADSQSSRLLNAVAGATPTALSPGLLEAETAENYALETAMWSGATLEQGVWYETSAPLALPGIARAVIPNRIEFAFTRMVPCTAAAAAATCVELVIHATPDDEALHEVIAAAALASYTESRVRRIVIDPATLFAYVREEQGSMYFSHGRGSVTVLQTEHLVSTTSYGADPAASTASVSSRDRGPL